MTRLPLYLLVTLLCSGVTHLMAQNLSFAPKVDGHYLDFITVGDDQTILITTEASYILSKREALKLDHVAKGTLTGKFQGTYDDIHLLSAEDGSVMGLSKDGEIVGLPTLDKAFYLKTDNGDRWKIDTQIWLKERYSKKTGYDLFDFYNPEETTYTEGLAHEQVLWLATLEKGLVRIERPKGESSFRVKEFNEASGLHSNTCTGLRRYGYTGMLIGHYGGLTSLNDFVVDFSHLTTLPVTQIEVDHNEVIWCLTEDALIKVTPDLKAMKVDIPADYDEKLLRFSLREDRSLMLLTDRSFHLLAHQSYKTHYVKNSDPTRPVSYYEIRRKKYYTDRKKVFGYNPTTKEWEPHVRKKAPQHVILERDRISLIFNGSDALVLSKDKAKKLGKLSIPDEETLLDITRIDGKQYYLTKSNCYERERAGLKLLNQEEACFYKAVSTEMGGFVFSDNGIYNLEDGDLKPLLAAYNHKDFPFTQNQFEYEGKLVTFTESGLSLLDTEELSMEEINLAPLKVMDIMERDELVWVLCSKSLIAISKESLLAGDPVTEKVLPLKIELKEGRLVDSYRDHLLYATTSQRIMELDLNRALQGFSSSMQLVHISDVDGRRLIPEDKEYKVSKKQLPLQLQYASNNYWTESAKYSYHLNFEGKNTSEWKSESTYELDVEEPGRHVLVAKYIDDIYGTKHVSDPMTFIVSENTELAVTEPSTWWHLPLILISLLLLWCGWWFKRRISI